MNKRLAFLVIGLLVTAISVSATPPSGAIFTTLVNGSEVNLNQFPSKEAVYLDGGPGINAPQTAAGLDDGRYVFQVTDPSGKRLLSTDKAQCRRFDVSAGIITNVVAVAGGCQHATGLDVDHGATTVQLFPYNDTPNPGGVYKVWIVTEDNFLKGCGLLGKNNGLNIVDCGYNAGNLHGFLPGDSKTDNFKVKTNQPREIDTVFIDDTTYQPLDGLSVTWIDTLGASNLKWSYYQKLWDEHIAHVEAVENGTHRFLVADQVGCKVGQVILDGYYLPTLGAQMVEVAVKTGDKVVSNYIYVYCSTK